MTNAEIPRPHSKKQQKEEIVKHCGNRTHKNKKKCDKGFVLRVERLYLMRHTGVIVESNKKDKFW